MQDTLAAGDEAKPLLGLCSSPAREAKGNWIMLAQNYSTDWYKDPWIYIGIYRISFLPEA